MVDAVDREGKEDIAHLYEPTTIIPPPALQSHRQGGDERRGLKFGQQSVVNAPDTHCFNIKVDPRIMNVPFAQVSSDVFFKTSAPTLTLGCLIISRYCEEVHTLRTEGLFFIFTFLACKKTSSVGVFPDYVVVIVQKRAPRFLSYFTRSYMGSVLTIILKQTLAIILTHTRTLILNQIITMIISITRILALFLTFSLICFPNLLRWEIPVYSFSFEEMIIPASASPNRSLRYSSRIDDKPQPRMQALIAAERRV